MSHGDIRRIFLTELPLTYSRLPPPSDLSLLVEGHVDRLVQYLRVYAKSIPDIQNSEITLIK